MGANYAAMDAAQITNEKLYIPGRGKAAAGEYATPTSHETKKRQNGTKPADAKTMPQTVSSKPVPALARRENRTASIKKPCRQGAMHADAQAIRPSEANKARSIGGLFGDTWLPR